MSMLMTKRAHGVRCIESEIHIHGFRLPLRYSRLVSQQSQAILVKSLRNPRKNGIGRWPFSAEDGKSDGGTARRTTATSVLLVLVLLAGTIPSLHFNQAHALS